MNSQKPTALGRSPQSGKLLRSLLLNVLTNAFLYVGQLLIARGLSREDYGTFTVVVSFVSLMALFADLGLTLLFVRKFAEASERTQLGDKEERGELLGSMLVLRIGLAVVVSGLVVTIAPLLGYPAETRHLMAIMLLTLFLSSRLMVVRSVGEAFLRGHNRFHMVAMFASIDAAVFAIGVWWMQHHHLTLEGAVWVYSLCHIPGFLLLTGFIASHAKETGFRLSFQFGILKRLVVEGFPLILSTAFLTIHNYIDALLLDKLSTRYEVSAYGAGIRILSATIFLPTVFSAVLGPKVTQALVRNDPKEIGNTVDRSIKLLLILAIITAVTLSSAPNVIISILFGADKYHDITPIVMIFGWAFVPICFATFLVEIAVAEGKLWLSTVYMGTLMVISVVADMILIPNMGAEGAAISKCTAVSVGAIILIVISRSLKVLEFRRIVRSVTRVAISTVAALAALYVLHYETALPEIVQALVIFFVLVVSIIVTKVFHREDILWLKQSLLSRRS